MLNAADRRLAEQFVELERQQLERSLYAPTSSSSTPQAASRRVTPPRPEPSAPPPPPPASLWEGTAAAGGAATRTVVAEFWTMGQNALMDGALEHMLSRFKPLYVGAPPPPPSRHVCGGMSLLRSQRSVEMLWAPCALSVRTQMQSG
jgi:hypothetical protein